uniref:Uncharacterized protein n=1 Tax=Cynoglossus semilaevis TaxID=244447 RepID=A0A3P8W7K7_CYNSE
KKKILILYTQHCLLTQKLKKTPNFIPPDQIGLGDSPFLCHSFHLSNYCLNGVIFHSPSHQSLRGQCHVLGIIIQGNCQFLSCESQLSEGTNFL